MEITQPTEKPRRGNSKERVLRAAGHLFSRQGYAATSIDEIATRAEASPSSIYWHFKGGKEDILVAVLEYAAKAYMQRLADAVRDAGGVLDKVDIFLADVRQQMADQPDTLRLIMQIALERAHVDAGVRSRIQNIYRNHRRAMVAEMRRSLPNEEQRRLERTAFLVTALLEGVFLQWQLDPEDVDIDGAFHLLRVLLYRQYGGPERKVPPLSEIRASLPPPRIFASRPAEAPSESASAGQPAAE